MPRLNKNCLWETLNLWMSRILVLACFPCLFVSNQMNSIDGSTCFHSRFLSWPLNHAGHPFLCKAEMKEGGTQDALKEFRSSWLSALDWRMKVSRERDRMYKEVYEIIACTLSCLPCLLKQSLVLCLSHIETRWNSEILICDPSISDRSVWSSSLGSRTKKNSSQFLLMKVQLELEFPTHKKSHMTVTIFQDLSRPITINFHTVCHSPWCLGSLVWVQITSHRILPKVSDEHLRSQCS